MSYDCISKYRSELMGVAILGVMLIHMLSWLGYVQPPFSLSVKLLRQAAFLVYTEGFLFFSGLGLYYSFTKDSRLGRFYSRRFKRLWVPYLLLAIPFYFYMDIIRDGRGGQFTMDVTTLTNLFVRNNGMWYIAFTAILYAVFPFAYKSVVDKGKMKWGRLAFIIFLCVALDASLYIFAPQWYGPVRIGYSKLSAFFLGMGAGYLSFRHERFGKITFLVVLLTFVVLYLPHNDFLDAYAGIMQRVLAIIVLCWLFPYLHHALLAVFRWFGKYTLELYILHMFLLNLFSTVLHISPVIVVTLGIGSSLLLCMPVNLLVKRLENTI